MSIRNSAHDAHLTAATGLPNLGLVCVTASEEVRFRALTRARYLKHEPAERERVLRDLYTENLRRTAAALEYCDRHGIRLYRVYSALFPFSDDALGSRILIELQDEMAKIGPRAAELGIRMVMHPDQFVVLNSESAQVVANSIQILDKHALAFDLFGLPRSQWATLTLHGGKSRRADQLVEIIGTLPEGIRSRLSLENDEHAYDAYEILDICTRAGVAMIFDNHHHVCHAGLSSYEDASVGALVEAARATWTKPEWQLVHLSNGRDSFNDRRHSELITNLPSAYLTVPWIEVEATGKEAAVAHLAQSLNNKVQPPT